MMAISWPLAHFEAEEGDFGIVGGSVAVYTYDRYTKKFRASIARRGHTNIIMAQDYLRDKRLFGMQLSLVENIESDGSSATRLSIHGYDWSNKTGYVQGLNLDQQLFYPKCTGFNHPEYIGNGICYNYPPYDTKACGWDGGDCDPHPL